MNRYGKPGGGGGPSKASATTLCQKCLQRDIHYSYECKSAAQERPYVSRPSRTQQLQNPKLLPKLSSDVPQELLRKKGIADEQLAKAEELRGRKRSVDIDEQNTGPPAPKRARADSISSVSTISTNKSASPEPTTRKSRPRPATRSPSPPRRARESTPPPREALLRGSGDRSSSKKEIISEKKRRRDSFYSAESYSSEGERDTRERTSSRNTRRRYQQRSPVERGRGTESRSPQRENGGAPQVHDRSGGLGAQSARIEHKAPKKERSLSPFSKRLALTQSRNAGH